MPYQVKFNLTAYDFFPLFRERTASRSQVNSNHSQQNIQNYIKSSDKIISLMIFCFNISIKINSGHQKRSGVKKSMTSSALHAIHQIQIRVISDQKG